MRVRYHTLAAVLIVTLGACKSEDSTLPAQEERSSDVSGLATEMDTIQASVDKWLIGWSTAQAASVRETCESDPNCDPHKYTPEARPETTFGWDGAERVERIVDWAEGARYRVRANGRVVLLYMRGDQVVGAYIETPDGGRSNICRDDDCYST